MLNDEKRNFYKTKIIKKFNENKSITNEEILSIKIKLVKFKSR